MPGVFFFSTEMRLARFNYSFRIVSMAASAKDPPLKLTSMLIGISLIKILVFYKIFF